MRPDKSSYISLIIAITAILSVVSCSTSKNTAQSRWWHAFNSRYNTYYNGAQAYIEGALQKENENRDNYTEIIPLYTVGNKQSRELGRGMFERAIEKSEKAIHRHSIKRRPIWEKKRAKTAKDIEWLNRREYNPFLWKVWMLMGRSQFQKGSFEDAASTFAYMSRLYSTQPAIYGKARAWLAKCYIENGWMYDAEDVIRNMQRDSISKHAAKEWDYTYTDYYLHTGEYEKAITYLKRVIKHEMRKKQKAREWFLMGQLEAALGHNEAAYKAFKHVIRQNPPYELEFNARIAMSEVMAGSQAKKMIAQLRRMSYSDKNKDYLDQVYYAIGNIYLSQKDTINAINAYEKGNSKATRSGIEKGVLLLHLGDLYWLQEKFSDAKRCYGEAIGLLDQDRADYKQLSNRSKILDELVPYTEAIHLQDSLQALAKMEEKDRNAAIDRIITALKKKEKEERDREAEQLAQQRQMEYGGNEFQDMEENPILTDRSQASVWYFYNQIAVQQGKAAFQRQWGRRENVDNWQRINKTVVASLAPFDEPEESITDSIPQSDDDENVGKSLKEKPENDPHKREYYLAQIPFTEEQVQASNLIIQEGLYNSGVIFKDKLDNLNLSEKSLLRLIQQYPGNEHTADAYYHLFLLYSRQGDNITADTYVNKLKAEYPDNQWTSVLTDPYFHENARLGTHIEDSLYALTYDAFKADRYREVERNKHISDTRFPNGFNRDKFIFIGGLSKLNSGDSNGCIADMKSLVEQFPDSRLSELAGMIINGVEKGRRLHGGKFDIDNIWSRRSVVLNDSDSIAARTFTAERNIPFKFIITYSADSINENQLLFELAKYNFTSFLVRNFDIEINEIDGVRQMVVSGFRTYDEALEYARQFYKQTNILKQIGNSRTIIISNANLELLGTNFSYNDYDAFYTKHFAPLKVSTYRLLTEPAEIVSEKEPEPEPSQEEIDAFLDRETYLEDNQTETLIPSETVIDNVPTTNNNEEATETEIIIPQDEDRTTSDEVIEVPMREAESNESNITTIAPEGVENDETDNTIIIPEPSENNTEQGETIIPDERTPSLNDDNNSDTVIPENGVEEQDETDDLDNGDFFYFNDDVDTDPQTTIPIEEIPETRPQKEREPQQDSFDIEDEYYDLDGF